VDLHRVGPEFVACRPVVVKPINLVCGVRFTTGLEPQQIRPISRATLVVGKTVLLVFNRRRIGVLSVPFPIRACDFSQHRHPSVTVTLLLFIFNLHYNVFLSLCAGHIVAPWEILPYDYDRIPGEFRAQINELLRYFAWQRIGALQVDAPQAVLRFVRHRFVRYFVRASVTQKLPLTCSIHFQRCNHPPFRHRSCF
jgi:hypothetical protein